MPNDTSDKKKVIKGRVYSASKLSILSEIRYRLWLRHPDDIVQYMVNWSEKKIYIQKKGVEFPDENGEALKEVKVIQDKWLYLPTVIRNMLWLQVGDYVEYISDSSGKLRFYLKKL